MKTFFIHREQADLIDASKAVFRRPNKADSGRQLIEVQNRINKVFNDLGSGNRPFLGNVGDKE